MDTIRIRGARTHNLKNVDLDIPRDKLVVVTGISGSGKSSLAFDTIYADGQRRYVESLSAYARQFLSMMDKPDVDHIEGLSPAISIEQKSTSHNPRSTVGTITEVYDYLRLLFARVGVPHCPKHQTPLKAQTVSQMVDHVLNRKEEEALLLLAPVVSERKGEHLQVIDRLQAEGFIRARINGKIVELDHAPKLELHKKHTIEVVVDRFKVKDDLRLRLAESFETALRLSEGTAIIIPIDSNDKSSEQLFSSRHACNKCGFSLNELEPRLFSFNNPAGACPDCDGLGIIQYFDPNKVIQNTELSLPGGAIKGWDRRNVYYFQMINSIASHYKFDIDTPFQELTDDIQNVILYGSGDVKIKFEYLRGGKRPIIRKHSFEGVIPNLQRRYLESESSMVREELLKYQHHKPCPTCSGTRLNESARNVKINDVTLPDITAMSVSGAKSFFESLTLTGARGKIASKILKEVNDRLIFLANVGLNYLTLERSAETLSGGEAQRIRLASQIGAGLVGVMYILDEPSIGLHQRDNKRLLKTLFHLRDLGNTVIVVEHDQEAINAADHVIDIGPGAGAHGGEIVAEGTPKEIAKNTKSLTGQYLAGKKEIQIPKSRTPFNQKNVLELKGASGNNLKRANLTIPVSLMTCITGVSGSGKSTLINDTLYQIVARDINRANTSPAPHKSISGLEHFDKVVDINQSPIGRTPRSNPATYTGLFTPIRELFAATSEARSRAYKMGRFSFNVKGGRCEACQGDGLIKVEMHFLPDIYVQCDQCKGRRYNRETLEIKYKNNSISDVLEMTVDEAYELFKAVPSIREKMETLKRVGLGYIKVGQQATTLSGGEAQRIKLAKELAKRATGRTFYVLDEPTTGLHFHDVKKLLSVLHELVDQGNTVAIIEHNLDVIKTADYIVDMGPEGGVKGGNIISEGKPEEVAENQDSFTGKFLKPLLNKKFKKIA